MNLTANEYSKMTKDDLCRQILDKDAEIGALVSNNEDLHATVERLQKELTHVRRELSLATVEVDAIRMEEMERAKMLDEIKQQPLVLFPHAEPSVQMIGTDRVHEENAALKTLVGIYIR